MILQLLYVNTIKPRHKAVIKYSDVQRSVTKYTSTFGFSFSHFTFTGGSNIAYEKSSEYTESMEESFGIKNMFDSEAHVHAIFQLNFANLEEEKIEFINRFAVGKRIHRASRKATVKFICYGITSDKYANIDYFTFMPESIRPNEVHQNFNKVTDFKVAKYYQGLLTYELLTVPHCLHLGQAKAYLYMMTLKDQYCLSCRHFRLTESYFYLSKGLGDKSKKDEIAYGPYILLEDKSCSLVKMLWYEEYIESLS